jgi:pimeloyl-ACP methyl ester carboxylesterase
MAWKKRRLNGVELAWEEIPGRKAPVLLLHGFTRTGSSHWVPADRNRFAGHRLLIPDLRGHGFSGRGDQPFTHALAAEDMYQLLKATDAVPAHCVGFSSGGMALYYLALAHPEVLRSLTVISSGIRVEEVTRREVERLCSPEANPRYHQVVRELDALHRAGQGEGYGERLLQEWNRLVQGAGDPHLETKELRRLHLPLLIIHGDRDQFFPVTQAVSVLKAVPGSRLLVIPGSSHFPAGKQQRDLIMSHTLRFIRELEHRDQSPRPPLSTPRYADGQ